MDQLSPYAVALCEQVVQYAAAPSYVKDAVIETDQRTVPSDAFTFVVFVFVMVWPALCGMIKESKGKTALLMVVSV